MARTKTMGLGAMLVLLVIAVAILPMIISFVGKMTGPHYMMSGFQDGPSGEPDGGVKNVPAIGRASQLPTFRPDMNTNYLCGSPNENGMPCPEGQFCDGTDQTCKPLYVGGEVPTVGYYA